MPHIEVILVDANDREVGVMEKLAAHQVGARHRAVSVYVFNSRNELLLQRRAAGKYHCGGLWSNTCCGHPLPGESTDQAAQRRLKEEMGLTCPMTKRLALSYFLHLPGGLIEHEYGHLYFARSDLEPVLNPAEADAFSYRSLEAIRQDIQAHPDDYTPWFKFTFPEVLNLRV
ncbi:isopentenyl-diphosphate Delta-isomerase [Pseudomonas sessilinigenes]|uniref:Isopentenyl-diphosphate Delta-isomerase n=1 Tax=Pseudomonas sessilinigenes TaxID=658629 RepID=A0ABX8MJD7_9PSED|nr:isopentenyl-diphosphate Delta-isomerase [Pseudomonas sessilinigenes]AZC26540.1 Isopentenyl-diphosphate Delta-isomerase [Pseudomonas sessilinigenes]QXH39454.1 isopentenyl-diphosphate Delta-isomerase [Pseudomonas sessilinigenes]